MQRPVYLRKHLTSTKTPYRLVTEQTLTARSSRGLRTFTLEVRRLQSFRNFQIYLRTAIQKESLSLFLKIYFTTKTDKNYISDLNFTKKKKTLTVLKETIGYQTVSFK